VIQKMVSPPTRDTDPRISKFENLGFRGAYKSSIDKPPEIIEISGASEGLRTGRRLSGHRDFFAQHVGAENAADERHQGEGGETDAPRQHGVPGVRWRVDQPSEPSHAYKWHDRCRNHRAADQLRAEMFVLGLPDGSAPSDRVR
jgi:hypothetical protein